MLPILGPIIAAIGSLGSSWLETRKVKAQGNIDIQKAKIGAKVTRIEKEAEMDVRSVDGMKHSWKDEWFTIILSAPFIASFIPYTQPYVRDGFEFLTNNTPDWYQWAFLGAVVASFGLRTWTGWRK